MAKVFCCAPLASVVNPFSQKQMTITTQRKDAVLSRQKNAD
jgi:hypothetical protein